MYLKFFLAFYILNICHLWKVPFPIGVAKKGRFRSWMSFRTGISALEYAEPFPTITSGLLASINSLTAFPTSGTNLFGFIRMSQKNKIIMMNLLCAKIYRLLAHILVLCNIRKFTNSNNLLNCYQLQWAG